MTIINCIVGPLGIIQLADSYVTIGETVTEVRDKIFAIPVEHTGYVTTAGCYQVGGVRMDEKGDYSDFRKTFQSSEDFWSRYSAVGDTYGYRAMIEGGSSLQFFNGLRSGREALVEFGRAMFGVFRKNWLDPSSPFGPPTTLMQSRDIFKLIMEAVCALAAESNDPAPYIGKPVISGLIHPPPNAVHMAGR